MNTEALTRISLYASRLKRNSWMNVPGKKPDNNGANMFVNPGFQKKAF